MANQKSQFQPSEQNDKNPNPSRQIKIDNYMLNPSIATEPKSFAVKPPSGRAQVNVALPPESTHPGVIASSAEVSRQLANLAVILPNVIGLTFVPKSARAKEEIFNASHAMTRLVRNPATGEYDLFQDFAEMPGHPFLTMIDAATPAATLEINGASCLTVNFQFRGFSRIFDATSSVNETRYYFRDGSADADRFLEWCEPEHESRGVAKVLDYVTELNRRNRTAWIGFLKSQTDLVGQRITAEQLDRARFKAAASAAGLPPSTPTAA
jgi:hypothetical protein